MNDDQWEKWIDRGLHLMALGLGFSLIAMIWIAIVSGIIEGVSR